jgi:hypothetical protein
MPLLAKLYALLIAAPLLALLSLAGLARPLDRMED